MVRIHREVVVSSRHCEYVHQWRRMVAQALARSSTTMSNADIRNQIDRLLSALHDGDGLKMISYGEQLQITEKQAQILVVLNFIYEGRLLQALGLIETGKTQVYQFGNNKFYTVDGLITTLSSPCACCQVDCIHYIAAILLSNGYSFLSEYLLTKTLGRREFLNLLDETTALV